MPELARCLTLFQYVQAVTGGPVARIDQAGSYAQPSLRGEAFAVRPGSIALRIDGAGIDTAVVARDGDTDSVTLRLLDAAGRTVHQGRLLSEGDRLLVGLAPTVRMRRAGGRSVDGSRGSDLGGRRSTRPAGRGVDGWRGVPARHVPPLSRW